GSGGQDLYVRAAAADLDSESSHHRIYLTVITVIIALFILILAFVGCCVWRRKKRSSTSTISTCSSLPCYYHLRGILHHLLLSLSRYVRHGHLLDRAT
ncbi:unnamed protein product, partial [Musa hybrid cultivar]